MRGCGEREEVTRRGGAFGRQSPREACWRNKPKERQRRASSCVEASERRLRKENCVWKTTVGFSRHARSRFEARNEGFVKRFGVWKQSLSRRDVFWRRANEGGTVWNLPVQKWQSALRGCLHMESTIDSYGEVIDRFGRRLAAEPLTVLNHLTAGHIVDPPAEPGPSTCASSGEQARSGFVC